MSPELRERLSDLADSGASIDTVVRLLEERRGDDALAVARELQRLARIETDAADGLARAESAELLDLAAKLHESAQMVKVLQARLYGERPRGRIVDLGSRVRPLRVVDSAEPGESSVSPQPGEEPGSAGSGGAR